MTSPIFIVDAFSDVPFGGNPAAVCLLDGEPPDAWLLAVAAEMKHSETAFLRPTADAWRLRWFTPATEVDLCGHATLAAAHVLWSESLAPGSGSLRFATRSGTLEARRAATGAVELDFPALPVSHAEPPPALVEALVRDDERLLPVAAGRNAMDWLLELPDEDAVRSIRPDFRALEQVDTRGVMVTAVADEETRGRYPGTDFVSRFFAPAVGVDEDPVTGSAHCALGPYWADRFDKMLVTGRQLSARGGTVRVEASGERVVLEGSAVTVVRGELAVWP